MNVPQTIKLLLDRINTGNQLVGGAFAAFGGTTGNIAMLQREANAAITLWRETHDTTGLKQLTATLQAYGNLTTTEYEQIMATLDGE
jgi:hypothetical protein